MRSRGFSLLEIMVVVAVIGVSGAMAVFAMSDQVLAARSRSDEMGIFLRLKSERNLARERMRGLAITTENEGHTMVFHKPVISGSVTRTCSPGEVIGRATFAEAFADLEDASECIDENGRPVGLFKLKIRGEDGRVNNVQITDSGQIVSELNERSGSNNGDTGADTMVFAAGLE